MQRLWIILNFIDLKLSNLFAQVCLLMLVSFILKGDLAWWPLLGFVAYVLMMVNNMRVSGKDVEIENLKKLYKKNGILPFLKGFNYSLLLGPLSLVLYFSLFKD